MTETLVCFDDGPTELTGEILDVLAIHRVRACFFVNGKNIEGHEDVLQRIVREGHELGNHGWSHKPMDEMPISDVLREVNMTTFALRAAAGEEPTRFRPPFRRWAGSIDTVLALPIELKSSLGDYDLTPEEIIEAAATETPPIYLHELPQTLSALPAILDGLTP